MIKTADTAALEREISRLNAQVTDLQIANTAAVERRRALETELAEAKEAIRVWQRAYYEADRALAALRSGS